MRLLKMEALSPNRFVSFYKIFVALVVFRVKVESKIVKHTFEIDYGTGWVDGVKHYWVLEINKKFPGPTIEAEVGDILQVDVINQIQDKQNTSIHWHGIVQKGYQFEDGPSMITQCPIRYGKTQRYEFPLTQWGTYWYHSHVGSQYGEGLWGALIIRNKKEVFSYDEEIIISLSDWYHFPGPENAKWYLSTLGGGLPPFPDSLLLNGLGRYPCPEAKRKNRDCKISQQKRYTYTIPTEKRYRIRVINSSSRTTFNFSIDNHKLETIEVDGVDVFPSVIVDIAEIGPAQRYSFIITADQKRKDEFLIRAEGELIPGPARNANQCANCTFMEVTAVLKYTRSQMKVSRSTNKFSYLEKIPERSSKKLRILNETDLIPFDKNLAILPSPVDHQIILNASRINDTEGTPRFYFNGTRFQLPDDKPILHKVIENDTLPNTFPYIHLRHNSVVEVVINNFFAKHPFHLHGHHFHVAGKFPMKRDKKNQLIPYKEKAYKDYLIPLKAPLRDTVLVPADSIVIIRFRADNPGVWAFHCHIEFHNLAGMGFVIIESAELLRKTLKITPKQRRLCNN